MGVKELTIDEQFSWWYAHKYNGFSISFKLLRSGSSLPHRSTP